MSLPYWGFWEAARIKEGLVVASWGLYWAMAIQVTNASVTGRDFGSDNSSSGVLTLKVTRVSDDGSVLLDLVEDRHGYFARKKGERRSRRLSGRNCH